MATISVQGGKSADDREQIAKRKARKAWDRFLTAQSQLADDTKWAGLTAAQRADGIRAVVLAMAEVTEYLGLLAIKGTADPKSK